MTSEERLHKIKIYGDAYHELISALQEFPKEIWEFRHAPNDWTVHEIIVHIADSEANSFVRCRRLIAEPGSTVMAYDEMQWARALHYHDQNTEDALELFRWLRGNTWRLLQLMPESIWTNTIYHPENGTMTMDDWLDVYARHVTDHIVQMRRVYELWQKK
jgi:hypothetical protein